MQGIYIITTIETRNSSWRQISAVVLLPSTNLKNAPHSLFFIQQKGRVVRFAFFQPAKHALCGRALKSAFLHAVQLCFSALF